MTLVKYNGKYVDAESTSISLDVEHCPKSLVHFIKRAWSIVEPGQPYIHNWHIDAIAYHLESITRGVMVNDEKYYNRLLINIPPGGMKSLLVNVFWPAWEWGPRRMPSMRYVCASHSLDLAIRDSTKMRRLVQSQWYQDRWGHIVTLTGDQNAKTKFENTRTGFRQAIAAGSITGARGDRVIIDDPLSVEDAASDAVRQTTAEWFEQAVPTRLNNPDKSAIIVIMQRLHEEDTSGIILEKQADEYDHIMIPMEYDPDRSAPTMLGWEDPRTEKGEPYFEARFPKHVIARDKKIMGSYAISGQYQQTPTPEDGGIIKQAWWQLWDEDMLPAFDYIMAAVDTAYTAKTENDYSAMTVWGVFSEDPVAEATRTGQAYSIERTYKQPHPRVMLIFAWQKRLEFHDLIKEIHTTATRFKVDRILVENKAAGLPVFSEMRRLYANRNYGITPDDPGSIDKIGRLYSVQHIFEEKLVYAPNKAWADEVIQQCIRFPKAKNDDLVDTVSMSMRYLRRTGLLQRPEEVQEEFDQGRVHSGAQPPPLYGI
jgi:predicted phage terminase large subunit-like protein